MTTRTITGPLRHPSTGAVWASAAITFRLLVPFATADATYGVEDLAVTTDASGQFSVTLAVPDSGAAQYLAILPTNQSLRLNLSAGAATTLHALIAAGATYVAPSAMQAAIDAHEQATSAHTFLHLSDAPDSYSGQANKVVSVKSDASGLEFSSAGGGAPSGPAGGVLGGTYPNPSFAVDMATQAELDTEASTRASADALRLLIANNLSDLANAATARGNLGLGALAILSSVTASLISDASANGRSLITAADYAAMRALLGLVIGTNVQAWDADLDTLAGMGASNASALAGVTAFIRTLLDDADAATALTTLGAATAIAEGRAAGSGLSGGYSFPGVDINTLSTSAVGGNKTMYSPIYVATPITIDQLAFEVTTISAGADARVGLYLADASWQPTTRMAASGAISVGALGVKTLSVSLTLAPGRYLTALMAPDNTVQFRRFFGGGRYGVIPSTWGALGFAARWQLLTPGSPTSTALPDPGTAWTASGASIGNGNEYMVAVRISNPAP